MSLRIVILFFLSFCFFHSKAQTNLNQKWVMTENISRRIDLSNPNKVIIKLLDNESSPREYGRIDHGNQIIYYDDLRSDTLTILKLEKEYLTLLQHVVHDTLKLYREIVRVDQNEAREFMSSKYLDIIHSKKNEKQITYKRKFTSLGVRGSNDKQMDYFAWRSDIQQIGDNLKLTVHNYNFLQRNKNDSVITKIEGDTLFAQDLFNNISLRLIRKKIDETIPTLLSGTYVMFSDKDKFEKALAKKNKTIYIGHTRLKILDENKCEFEASESNGNGFVYVHDIAGTEYFICHGIDNQERNNFHIVGTLGALTADYFRLDSRIQNMSLNVYDKSTDIWPRQRSYTAPKYLEFRYDKESIYFLKID